jgi:hypothetical protein
MSFTPTTSFPSLKSISAREPLALCRKLNPGEEYDEANAWSAELATLVMAKLELARTDAAPAAVLATHLTLTVTAGTAGRLGAYWHSDAIGSPGECTRVWVSKYLTPSRAPSWAPGKMSQAAGHCPP